MDHDDDVLYCYEIQLEESVRRLGLGKFMMKVLELMMMKADLLKIMLTVFKFNEAATKLFRVSAATEYRSSKALKKKLKL